VRRILVATLAAAIGLMGVAAAFAAPPIKEAIVIDESDANFCGTGEVIEIDGAIHNTLWIGTTGGDPTQVVRAHVNIDITYTNPDNGAAVVERWSFMSTNQIISGLESGVHTHEFTENGLKAKFKLAHGRVITRDAGSLTYRVTFDANDQVTDFEPVTIHGPHPGFNYEGNLFCDTLVPALGLD
jgi:hypothetical protein